MISVLCSIRLIINITSPVLLLFNEQVPTEKMQRTIYLKLISYTQSYKVALIDGRIWTILSNRLSEIIKLVSIKFVVGVCISRGYPKDQILFVFVG